LRTNAWVPGSNGTANRDTAFTSLNIRLLLNVVVADRVIELQKGMAAGVIQAEITERNARVVILQELVDGATTMLRNAEFCATPFRSRLRWLKQTKYEP
jgi:hypothetical protein